MGAFLAKAFAFLVLPLVLTLAPDLARAALRAQPLQLNFGPIAVVELGSSALPTFVEAPVSITNSGRRSLALESVRLESGGGAFELAAPPASGTEVAPGGRLTLWVRARAGVEAAPTASLLVRFRGGQEAQVPLAAQSVPVRAEDGRVTLPPLFFGETPVGGQALRRIGATSTTGRPIESGAVGGEGFARVEDREPPGRAGSGAIEISFRPASERAASEGTLTLRLGEVTATVPLHGIAGCTICVLATANLARNFWPRTLGLRLGEQGAGYVTGGRNFGPRVQRYRYMRSSNTIELLPAVQFNLEESALSAAPLALQRDQAPSLWLGIGGDGAELRAGDGALLDTQRYPFMFTSALMRTPMDHHALYATARDVMAERHLVRLGARFDARVGGRQIVARPHPLQPLMPPGVSLLSVPRFHLVQAVPPSPNSPAGGVATAARAGVRASRPYSMAVLLARTSRGAKTRYRLMRLAPLEYSDAAPQGPLAVTAMRTLDGSLGRPMTMVARKLSHPRMMGARVAVGFDSGLLHAFSLRESGPGEWTFAKRTIARRAPFRDLDLASLASDWFAGVYDRGGRSGARLMELRRGELITRADGFVSGRRARFMRMNVRENLLHVVDTEPPAGAVSVAGPGGATKIIEATLGLPRETNLPPEVVASPDTEVIVSPPAMGADVMLSVAATDPNGDQVTYAWGAPGVQFDDPTSPTPTGFFPVGKTVAWVVARDVRADPAEELESLADLVIVRVSYPAAAPEPPAGAPFGLAIASSNPFVSRIAFRLSLPEAGAARLAIFDVRGRLVRTLVDGVLGAGLRPAEWDGTGADGERLASGIYFARLDLGARTITRRVVSMR